MPDETAIRDAFTQQADFCRDNGSPMTADILEAARDALSRDVETGRRVLDWKGDPTGAGGSVALRLAGGLHALARSGDDEALTAAYRGEKEIGPAIAEALERHDAELAGWLDSPPQTNEVGRAAMVVAGLLAAASRYPLPIDLIELGSSAGLVLNLDRYRYDLGGRTPGEETSPLLLKPDWEGPPPPDAPIEIITQRGVDRSPIYLSTPEAGERLVAYIWPDQRGRIERAEQAIGLARAFTPPVVSGEADEWVERRLAEAQAEGVLRILFHTIALQYFLRRCETAGRSGGADGRRGGERDAALRPPLIRAQYGEGGLRAAAAAMAIGRRHPPRRRASAWQLGEVAGVEARTAISGSICRAGTCLEKRRRHRHSVCPERCKRQRSRGGPQAVSLVARPSTGAGRTEVL